MKKTLVVIFWIPTTIFTLLFCTSVYCYREKIKVQAAQNPDPVKQIAQMPYQFYASIPKVLGAETIDAFYVKSQDITPKLVKTYLEKFKSPMLDSYQQLILAANSNQIDPLLLVAIAQCESNLGKKMPHETDDIYECHNPFGWGIHKGGTLCFASWEEGYEAVAVGLRKKYYDQGLTNPEEIMEKYTPPALEKGGSWAKCVNQFLKQLNQLKDQIE